MAIPKKKMAGKPAMMKKRKAQGGITLTKNPDTDEKNALTIEKNKELPDVTKREGFGEQMKKFYKADIVKADSAKTKAGKILGKIRNTAIKIGYTPHRIVLNALSAAGNAAENRRENKAMDKKKMGGKVAKKVAPKMMIKKTTSKKKK